MTQILFVAALVWGVHHLAGEPEPTPGVGANPSDSTVVCVRDSPEAGGLGAVRVPADRPVEAGSGTWYAAGRAAFEGSWIRILGNDYGVAGAPRRIDPALLAHLGERQGASVFVERGVDLTEHPEVVYLLDPSCGFVPFRSRYWSRQ